jgi:tetratricopeptide (TPR) repeat protein
MRAFLQFDRQKGHGFVSALCSGLLLVSLALASPAFASDGGGGGAGGGAEAGGGAGGGGAGGGGASGGGAGGGGAMMHRLNQSDLTTCAPSMLWIRNGHRCRVRHSGVVPDPDLTEYAYALAKADRYQEAIDVLDLLDNPSTPRALNYHGYATRKLGRTDEGIGYYLKSVVLDPKYSQVGEYLRDAYVLEGKYDLAKEQLSRIEKLCGKDCEYYEDLAGPLIGAHAL